jgi:putative oxidoreductase
MLTALFAIHAADPFARQEPALYYLLVYVVLLIAGSGKYSVDYLLQRKHAMASQTNQKVKDSTFAIYQ